MPLSLVTGPTAEPISLAEAKTHLRVSDTAQDMIIALVIAAARAACETKTQRQIVAARWKFVLDGFPGPSLMGVPMGRVFSIPAHAVRLPLGPVLNVVSIKYLDPAGTQQTMPSTDYATDLTTEGGIPARITPVFGKIWPVTLPQIGCVEIIFDAGYAAPLTANAGADTISVPGWKTLAVNDAVRLSNRDSALAGDGSLPGGMAANKDYFVRSVAGTDLYTLSASSGGALLDITSAGAGDNFIGTIPQALKAWMLLTLGALYENRETFVIDTRITDAAIPPSFIDSLLDPYRIVEF